MRETDIVQRIRTLAGSGHFHPSIITGIGDDAAVLRPRAGEDLVFTSDFVLEGRHFTLETHRPADIGHKALARSLSDLAAMGSEPVFCLVSLAIPSGLAASWIDRFYKGLLALADRYKITLAGGDLARFDKIIVDVICCGRVPRGKALLRSGARPDDRIYVTGELGGSAHGFAAKQGAAWRRHLRPEPRIAAGVALRKLGVSACMDLSDGLSLDLARLCAESSVGAEIGPHLPVAPRSSLREALHGGEDYELLFTAAARRKIPNEIAGLRVTNIGSITAAHAGEVRFAARPLRPKGFDHFA
ncbi:MAG TPA: thiamine-phosphate kinase [Bryobacteraceae bacterium]|jgi:thiamine-monophosphate kinase